MGNAARECDDVRRQLLDFIEGDLSAGSRQGIDAHLARCPACAKDLLALRKIIGAVGALPDPPAPPGLLDDFAEAVQGRVARETPPRLSLWRRVTMRAQGWAILRPASALAVACVLGLLLVIGLMRASRPPHVSPDVFTANDAVTIAQNLDVLEQLDLLEDLDVLERIPLLRGPDTGQPPQVS